MKIPPGSGKVLQFKQGNRVPDFLDDSLSRWNVGQVQNECQNGSWEINQEDIIVLWEINDLKWAQSSYI